MVLHNLFSAFVPTLVQWFSHFRQQRRSLRLGRLGLVYLLCASLLLQPLALLSAPRTAERFRLPLSRALKATAPFVQTNTLSLSPATATHTVGANRCVVASFTNASGQPMAGSSVSFTVAGANATTGNSVTNNTGQATFCYTGAIAGTDTITANVGSVTATATKTWRSAALIASEAVIVRHGWTINSGSRIEGAVRQLLGESTTFNTGAVVTGDLLVPGTPQLIQNGTSNFGGTITGTGSASPTGYSVTLNTGITLGKLRNRINPITVANIPAPPAPTGTRSVTISATGQSIGDPATLRNLTLNSNVGQVAVPPGTYGTFIANSSSGFTFGVAGATQPVTYNLTNFTLNSSSQLQVVSPVILVLANGTTLNATAGSNSKPGWLSVRVASGAVTLNTGSFLYGGLVAPASTVTLNANSQLIGNVTCDRLTLNGNCLLRGAGNQAPVVSVGASGSQTITLPTNSVNLSATVSDDGLPGGAQTLTWSKVSGPGTVTFGNANAANTSATFNAAGTYVLRVSVNDGDATGSDDLVVTVLPANLAPVVNAGPDQSITLPTNSATLSGTVTDDGLPTGNVVTSTWSKISGPGTVTFTNANAASTAATFSSAGVYLLRLSASDGALSASDDVQITVNAANQAPTVSAGANQTVTLGTNLVLNPGNEFALVGGQITNWNVVSGNWTQATAGTNGFPTALTGSTYFYAGDNASAELRQDVNVSAYAATIASGTQLFDFAGWVRSGDETPADSARVIVEYRDATNANVLATYDSAAQTATNNWQRLTDTRPAPSGTGWIRVRLLSTRNSGTGNNGYFDQISLRAVAGVGLTLNGTVSDDGLPTGSTVTQTWSKVSGPGNITFANANALSTAATISSAGVYVLRLTANDSALSATSDVTITVNAGNVAPTVNAGANQMIDLPNTASLNGTVSDDGQPAGSSVSTRWSQTSGPGTVTFANPTAATTTASFSVPGTYVLRLAADDSDAITTSEVTITVRPQNLAPVVNVGPDVAVTLPSSATLNGSVTDDGLPNNALTISWSKVSGPGTVTFSAPAAATTAASFSQAGSYVLRLTASDGALTTSDEVTVTVSPANQPPVVHAGLDQLIAFLTQATLSGTATDDGLPAGSSVSVTWSKVSGPGTVTFAFPNALTTTASFSAAGVYVLRLTATDGVLSASDEITITVNQAPTVNAGADQTIAFPNAASLTGTATDDGLPTGSNLAVSWSKVSGPGDVTFSAPNALSTNATFSISGVYTLRLTATDGTLTTTDEVVITANQAPVVNAGATQSIPFASATQSRGMLVVNSDEWAISSSGYTATPQDAPRLALNLAALFTGGRKGKFLVVSTNFGLTSTELATTITNAGHTWVVDANANLTLTNLLQYDGVFVGYDAVNNQALVDYLKAGGNVYLTGGTDNDAAGEAARWSFLLQTFGMEFISPNNTFNIFLPITSSHRLFTGVNSLRYYLGSSIRLRVPGDPNTLILQTHAGENVIGIYEASGKTRLNGVVTDDGIANGTLTLLWSKVSGPGTVTFSNSAQADPIVTFSAPGSYVLRLTANDGWSSTSQDVTIQVVRWNDPPAVNAGADQTIAFPNATSLIGTATDDGLPTGSSLVVSWTKVSGPGTVTFGTANAAHSTVSFSQPGNYVLRLTASDGTLTTSDDLAVSVNAVNQAPMVNAGADQTVTLPNPVNLVGTVTDDGLPTGSNVTVSWSKVSGPGTVTFSAPTALNTTVTFNLPGTYVLRLTAGDTNATSSDDVIVTATATCLLPSGLVSWWTGNNTFNDSGGTNHGVAVNETAFVSGQIAQGFSFDGVNDAVSIPDHASLQPATLSVEAWVKFDALDSVTSDAGLQYLLFKRGSGSFDAFSLYKLRRNGVDNFNFLVGSAQNVRQAAISTTNIQAGQYYHVVGTFDGSQVKIYLNGVLENTQPANYSIGYAANKALVLGGSGESFDGHFKGVLDEVRLFHRALSASEVSVAYQTFCQSTGNHPPSVNAGPDVTITMPDSVTLNGSVTDDGLPTGSTLTRTWSKVSGPGNVTFSASNAAVTNASFSTDGVYILRLSASDSELTSYDEVTVRVFPNICLFHPTGLAAWWTGDNTFADALGISPGSASGNVTFGAGKVAQAMTFDGVASAVTIPSTAAVKPAQLTVETWVNFTALDAPGAQDTGLQYLLFNRGNGPFEAYALYKLRRDGVDRLYFSVGSDPAGNARTAAVSSSTIQAGQWYHVVGTYDGAQVRIYVNGRLEQSQPATYAIGYQSGKPLVLGSSGESFDGRLKGWLDEVAIYSRAVTESEIELIYNTYQRAVCQSQNNHPPQVNAGADQVVVLPNSANLTGLVTDDGLPSGSALTVNWAQVSGPGTVSFANAQSAATSAAFSVAGSYVLRLTGSDTVYSVSDEIVITVAVTPPNQAPVVNAGADVALNHPTNNTTLNGTVTDDGLPTGSSVSSSWSKVSGPGTVTFASPNTPITQATFSAPGSYTLRLTASDTALTASDEVIVRINQAPVVNAGTDATISIGDNLVQNPGNEAALVSGQIPNWTVVSGNWTQATAGTNGFPTSYLGSTYFYAGENAGAELRQDVNVSAYAAGIAAGTQQFAFQAFARVRNETPADLGKIIFEFRDATNTNALATITSADLTTSFAWEETGGQLALPAATRWIRVRLLSTRNSGSTNDAYFDQVSIRALGNAGLLLAGSVTDDGLPLGNTLTATWSKVSGPGTTAFANANTAATAASLTTPGVYTLRLTGNDGALSATDDVTVTVVAGNQAPTANAGPDVAVTIPSAATLNGAGTDDGLPTGVALGYAWSVVSGPAPVTFTAPNAAVTNATFTVGGTYVLRLSVNDSEYLATDDVTVTVIQPANQAPVVSAGPDKSITLPTNTVQLDGSATDDGLPVGSTLQIVWNQVSGPSLATFSNANAAVTTVSNLIAGTYVFRLNASDGVFVRTDDVIVTVIQPNLPPVVNAGADQTIILGAPATLNVSVTDDGLPVGSTVSVVWSQVSGPGTVSFSDPNALSTTINFSTTGVYTLRLTASDTQLTASDDVVITVNPATAAPTAAIMTPTDDVTITERTDINGVVAFSTATANWKLEYSLNTPSGQPNTTWTEFGSGTTAVGTAPSTGGFLAKFDPTLLLNGSYTLRLTVTDATNQTRTSLITATVEGQQKIGVFSLAFDDASLPLPGLPVSVLRSYDSRNKQSGDFGVGWQLALSNVRVEKTGELGFGWSQVSSGGLIPTYQLTPNKVRKVSLTFPDGRIYKFRLTPNPSQQQGAPISGGTTGFTQLPGTAGTNGAVLEALDHTNFFVAGGSGLLGSVDLFDVSTSALLNPTRFKLTTAEKFVYVIDQTGGVQTITDPNGNVLSFTANGITHSAGLGVTFTRDANGRITQITDPNNKTISYAYNAAGDLISVTDRENRTTQFTYDAQHKQKSHAALT